MSSSQTTLLVTVTGRDRPGVTSRLFTVLAAHELSVLDVEQVVIRGRLVLGVLLSCGPSPDLTAIHRQVAAVAADLGLEAEITAGSAEPARRRGSLHVTVLGRELAPAAIAAIAGRIAANGANIERISRLAHRPVTCIEFDISGADPAELRLALARESAERGVDVAVQRGGLYRRAMRLVVMDVDSTLVSGEAIDLLAARAGCEAKVAELTAATMRGELEFAAALRERVSLLAGLDAAVLDEVRAELRLAPGARTLIRTLRRLGYRCGIVSGGFTQFTDVLAADLGLDYAAANTM
jgi:phosphoserine phosphatase